jgi:hypothetical protein
VVIHEFVEEITVFPDYLAVEVHGAPAVHVFSREAVGAERATIPVVPV